MTIRNVAAMVPAGRFLEISAPAPDIQDSLDFYLRLGFTELSTNDIRDYPYAAISDGRIVIGLHAHERETPSLTFVQEDVAKHARELDEAGVELLHARLSTDVFNEAVIAGPDGHLIMMIEARTFSRTHLDELGPTLIGHCAEINLRCRDLLRGTVFFEGAGLSPGTGAEGATTLVGPGITLRLDEHERSGDPVLRFITADLGASLDALAAAGMRTREEIDGHLLLAPEGTRMVVREAG